MTKKLLFLLPLILLTACTIPERKFVPCKEQDRKGIAEAYMFAKECVNVYTIQKTEWVKSLECLFDKDALDVVCKEDRIYVPTEYFRVEDGINKEHFLKSIDNWDRGTTYIEIDTW